MRAHLESRESLESKEQILMFSLDDSTSWDQELKSTEKQRLTGRSPLQSITEVLFLRLPIMESEYERPRSYSYSNSHVRGAYSYNSGYSNNMQLQPYYGGGGGGEGGGPTRPPHELRCYSASYAQTQVGNPYNNQRGSKDMKLRKGKSTSGSCSKSWSFSDPEFQRRKRVASYKMYSVEGKVKGTFRKSLRWIKDRYTQVVHG